jgi:hypothetical protein
VLLAQADAAEVTSAGARAAERLGLAFERRLVGLEPFAAAVAGVSVTVGSPRSASR